MNTRVEEVSSFIYDILEKLKEHNLSDHEDRRDIAWIIAKQIYDKYKAEDK